MTDAEEMGSAEIQKQTCRRTRQVSQPSPFKQAKEIGKGILMMWIAIPKLRVPGLLSGYGKSSEGFKIHILRT